MRSKDSTKGENASRNAAGTRLEREAWPDHLVVFVGDAQAAALTRLCWLVTAGERRDGIRYLWPHQIESDYGANILDAASVIAVQDDGTAKAETAPILADRRSIAFPALEGDFLWPYASEPAFYNFALPSVPGPYPAHLGDEILNICLRRGMDAAATMRRYDAAPLLEPTALKQLYDWRIGSQAALDRLHGFDLAPLITTQLPTTRLFRTRFHLQPVLLHALASRLLPRLNLSGWMVDGALASVGEDVFPLDEMPVHPKVAAHFGLGWAGAEARYSFGVEETVTFERFVDNYLAYRSNHDLRVACAWARAGDAVTALRLVEAGLERMPAASEGWCAKGLLLRRLSRAGEAAPAFEKAVELTPENGVFWTELAHARFENGELDQAIAAARKGAACLQGGGVANVLLSRLLPSDWDGEELLACYSRAAPFRTDDLLFLQRAGIAALRAERFAFALEAGENLVRLWPDIPDHVNLVAESLEGLGRRPEAIQQIEAGLARNTSNDQTYMLLGNFHLRDGELLAAKQAFVTGHRIAPDREDFLVCQAQVRLLMDQTERA